jgi:hypothetical protein
MAPRRFDLDMSEFARTAPYGVDVDGKQFDLATFPKLLRPTFENWAQKNIITRSDSFGYAMGTEKPATWLPNEPYKAVWFVTGWGPEGEQRMSDAVRMLAAMWRIGLDTLQVRLEGRRHRLREVESVVDGRFPYGNIVRGGAALVRVGDLSLPCAVGGPNEVDNNLMAKTVGAGIGTTMLKVRSEGPSLD